MKIREMRELLIGKEICYYNGFNGYLDYFVIGHVVKKGSTILVHRPDGNGEGIFIPQEKLSELVRERYCTILQTIEGCTFREEWKLNN